jgi:hypothetical protein
VGQACEEGNRRYDSDDEVIPTKRDRQGRKHRDARKLPRALDENSLPVAGMHAKGDTIHERGRSRVRR